MVKLAIALIVLSACGSHQAPAVAAPAPAKLVNRAVEHALNSSIEPACIELRTGDPKQADEAICVSGRILLYCYAGKGLGSECVIAADFRPKPEPTTPPQAPAPVAPAKSEPAKPEPVKDPKAKK